MLRVALTGGLGSGKSTVAHIFRELGCFVSQSDEVARAMMQPGESVYQRIVEQFGPGVLQADGSLNRATLATLAFAQDRAEDLNSIIHPAVIAAQAEWMRRIGEEHPSGVAMVESALVFETKHAASPGDATPWRSRFDRVVLVTAPESLRIQRYVDRYFASAHASSDTGRAAAEADARNRMRAQWTDERKAALSDFAIPNEGTLEDLRQAVTEVWKDLRDEAARRTRHGG
ncbi:dephospho-CoA kinase [Terriglobus aquaticus]|uniref:Dephospho-CoA kinase n=1 Tax=Terriglobus aquaticus TaxID=940139 RepID=A0ABW9KGI3_9BACT|nr:dephospho-CoA kinase [Terriglobus aquaticus]